MDQRNKREVKINKGPVWVVDMLPEGGGGSKLAAGGQK